MKGEEEAWFKVASHLQRTVQEAKDSMSSTEFVQWVHYLEKLETSGFHREDYNSAAIIAEIRRGNVKNPRSVTVEGCMLKFSAGKGREKKFNVKASKSFWFANLGLDKEGRQVRKKKGKRTSKVDRKARKVERARKIKKGRRKR